MIQTTARAHIPFRRAVLQLSGKGGIEQAYFIWFGMSLTLFLAGIAVTAKAAFNGERLKGSLIFCLGWPFRLSLEHARCRPDRIDRFFCCCNGHLSRSAIEVFCERIAALDSDL